MALNTIERVVQYLVRHQNLVICDDCFATELRVRGSLTRMLDVLNPEYVRRCIATCHLCGNSKMSVEQFRPIEGSRRRRVVQNS